MSTVTPPARKFLPILILTSVIIAGVFVWMAQRSSHAFDRQADENLLTIGHQQYIQERPCVGMSDLTPTVLPRLTVLAAANGEVSLYWTPVVGAVTYNVKQSESSGGPYTQVASVTKPVFLADGLADGTTYYYIVTAVKPQDKETAPSNQVAATPKSCAFAFLNIAYGATLSGEPTLEVSMRERDYGGEGNQVTEMIDGKTVDMGGDVRMTGKSGNVVMLAVMGTDSFPNGPHVISVRDAKGQSASVNVKFENYFTNVSADDMFDPAGGDGLPKTCAIKADLTAVEPWSVSIVTIDNKNKTVRSWHGRSQKIAIVWDAKTSAGVPAPDDAYQIILRAFPRGKQPVSDELVTNLHS